ncbi:MAG TPA: hypothetical protein VF901_18780 [Bradyrhizobium sp.]
MFDDHFSTIHISFKRDFMTETRSKARPPQRTADDLRGPPLVAALLLAVVAAFGLHALFVSGPAMREAAEAELARVIADEDRDVCGQFGMRPDTAPFATCSSELAIVRRKQSDRDHAAAAGIL